MRAGQGASPPASSGAETLAASANAFRGRILLDEENGRQSFSRTRLGVPRKVEVCLLERAEEEIDANRGLSHRQPAAGNRAPSSPRMAYRGGPTRGPGDAYPGCHGAPQCPLISRLFSPEDLIASKILAGRPKDIEDVRGILQEQMEVLDYARIRTLLSMFEDILTRSDLLSSFQQLLGSVQED